MWDKIKNPFTGKKNLQIHNPHMIISLNNTLTWYTQMRRFETFPVLFTSLNNNSIELYNTLGALNFMWMLNIKILDWSLWSL